MVETSHIRFGRIAIISATVGAVAWVVLAAAGPDADSVASYFARILVFFATAAAAIAAVAGIGFDKNTKPATIAAVIVAVLWLMPFLKSIWMAVAVRFG